MDPTRRLLTIMVTLTMLLAIGVAMFSLTGGTLRPGGTFGMKISDVLYDPPPVPQAPGPPPPTGAAAMRLGENRGQGPAAPTGREPGVPETPAEEQYYAAIRKADEQERRQAERLKERDELVGFLQTPLGRDLVAVAELGRRGRTREAREYAGPLLEALGDKSLRVQVFALKLALHLYKAEKDAAGASKALKKYLELIKRRLVEARDATAREKKTTPESLAEIESLLAEVAKLGGAP